MSIWTSEDNLRELALSFSFMGPRDWMQVSRHGRKYLDPCAILAPPPFPHSPEPLQLQLLTGLFQCPGSSPALESDQTSDLRAHGHS